MATSRIVRLCGIVATTFLVLLLAEYWLTLSYHGTGWGNSAAPISRDHLERRIQVLGRYIKRCKGAKERKVCTAKFARENKLDQNLCVGVQWREIEWASAPTPWLRIEGPSEKSVEGSPGSSPDAVCGELTSTWPPGDRNVAAVCDADILFTSNEYLDFFIYDIFFKNSRTALHGENGFYVEVGGSNGVHASNTFFYDHCLGWRGVLVEATGCAECAIPVNRPSATVVAAAIGRTLELKDMAALSSTFCEQCPPPTEPRRVLPLAKLFEEQNVAQIDFLSIDVETESIEALRSIDFSAVSISVILVEAPLADVSFVEEYGYESYQISVSDTIFWRTNTP